MENYEKLMLIVGIIIIFLSYFYVIFLAKNIGIMILVEIAIIIIWIYFVLMMYLIEYKWRNR